MSCAVVPVARMPHVSFAAGGESGRPGEEVPRTRGLTMRRHLLPAACQQTLRGPLPVPHFQEESVATLIFPSRITRCRVSFGGQSDGIRHMVQVTLLRSRMQDGPTSAKIPGKRQAGLNASCSKSRQSQGSPNAPDRPASSSLTKSPAGSLRDWQEQQGIEHAIILDVEAPQPTGVLDVGVHHCDDKQVLRDNITGPVDVQESSHHTRYGCDWDCGFSGEYCDVQEHERTCAMRPDDSVAVGNGSGQGSDGKDCPPEAKDLCLPTTSGGMSNVLAEGSVGQSGSINAPLEAQSEDEVNCLFISLEHHSAAVQRDTLTPSGSAQLMEAETVVSTASTEPRKLGAGPDSKLDAWPRRTLWGSSPIKLIGAASPFLACGILTPAMALNGPLTPSRRTRTVEDSPALPLVA